MKVPSEAVALWLKDPVTLVYLDALKEVKDNWSESMLSGNCKSSDPKTSTSDLYHFHLGLLKAIDICISPMDILREQDKVTRKEDGDDKGE